MSDYGWGAIAFAVFFFCLVGLPTIARIIDAWHSRERRIERIVFLAAAICASARESDPGTSHEDDMVVNFALLDELRDALAKYPEMATKPE